jgi:hypothetical protein
MSRIARLLLLAAFALAPIVDFGASALWMLEELER